jgi:hypothetical protein
VNAEDTDWLVYHRIPENRPVTEEGLLTACGIDAATLAASLGRLEQSCLVERTGECIRVLNFGEALLRNQCKYEKGLPFEIVNGVIRARRN